MIMQLTGTAVVTSCIADVILTFSSRKEMYEPLHNKQHDKYLAQFHSRLSRTTVTIIVSYFILRKQARILPRLSIS
jgi:hypothetical protein